MMLKFSTCRYKRSKAIIASNTLVFAASVILTSVVVGCSSMQPVLDESLTTSRAIPSRLGYIKTGAILDKISINQGNIAPNGPVEAHYRIGYGDRLKINIYGESGLEAIESRVDADGIIQLPIMESMVVIGKTPVEVQSDLKRMFLRVFKDPWIVVEVSEYRSRPVYLLGEFNTPGVIYMDQPTSILQALGLGQGLSADAYLPGARLLRDNHIVAVDIDGLLSHGFFKQNVWMKKGDTLYVPNKQDLKVYVLGAVNKPGMQQFGNGTTLLQALSQAAGPKSGSARLKETRLIRTHSPTKGDLLTVNVRSILDGSSPDLPLQSGDIIYIPNTMLGSWNAVIERIVPTLSLISGTLEPFIQLKYLDSDSN